MPRQRGIGVLLALAGAIFSSSKAVIIKLAYAFEINAISLLTLRMLMALPVFLALGLWSLRRSRPVDFGKQDWMQLLFVGLLGYYLASLFDFIGLQYITAGLERLIVFAYPTLVVLLGWLIWRRKILPRQWLALLLTYLGIALALSGDVVIPDPMTLLKGSLWVFACALAYAAHLLGSEHLLRKTSVVFFSSWAMVAASLGVFAHAWLAPVTVQLWGHPPQVYTLAALLTLITTILPPFLMSAAIIRLGAGSTAILGSIGPISTLLLAWWLLGEILSPIQMIGAAVVLSGVTLIVRRKRPPTTEGQN